MSRYTGSRCVICDKYFSDGDDIVVCPECGTPYHRDCYHAAGKCVAEGLHKSGTSWHTFQIESGNIIVCKNCGTENTPEALFCKKCGRPTKMDEYPQYERQASSPQANPQNANGQNQYPNGQMPYVFLFDEYCGISPDEDFEGVKLSEIADFIGPNKRYYLPIFKRMKDTGKKISFNWSGLLFPHYYFAYRKMYFPAFLAIIYYIIVELQVQLAYLQDTSTLIYSLISKYPDLLSALSAFSNSAAGNIFNVVVNYLYIGVMIVFAIFSNWFYYRHCLKRVKELKASGDSSLKETAKKKGGTSFKSVIVAFICLLPFIALGMAENINMIK